MAVKGEFHGFFCGCQVVLRLIGSGWARPFYIMQVHAHSNVQSDFVVVLILLATLEPEIFGFAALRCPEFKTGTP
eukprot:SAG31_NODE_7572_length_1651_cov_0.978737_4_plen_75_part_00